MNSVFESQSSESFITPSVKWLVPIFTLCVISVTIYNWRRRWLYYYGAKLPGPFGFPLVGSVHLLREGPSGIYKFLRKLFDGYPSVVGIWFGPDLYVSTTEPSHLKTILTNSLDKGDFYLKMGGYFHRALAAAAPVDLWRQNRKNVNPSFNVTLINSFVEQFVKHAKIFAKDLNQHCGKDESDDIFPTVWKCTLNAACETLGDVDSSLVKTEDFIPVCYRIEEILIQRFFNPICYFDPLWKFSPLKKEMSILWKKNCSLMEKLIDLTRSKKNADETSAENSDDSGKKEKKRFLDNLLDLADKNEIPYDYVIEESQIMFFVGTETSTVALCTTIMLLGMYPEVQKRIDQELLSIFGDDDRDPTLEDTNRMEYLERVIKEALRIFPPIPFVLRGLDKNVDLGSYVFPKDAKVIIPILTVHRKPEYWPDPLNFDPDRFLPQEVEKRPVCSYLPFSYGVRNCIGYKYGILSMKVILATVLRQYRILSSNYKSIEDVDLLIHVVAKAKNGYKIKLERKE